MEYKIVNKFSGELLEYYVNDLISKGWEPIGGICVNTDEFDRECLYQAMIKKGAKNEAA